VDVVFDVYKKISIFKKRPDAKIFYCHPHRSIVPRGPIVQTSKPPILSLKMLSVE